MKNLYVALIIKTMYEAFFIKGGEMSYVKHGMSNTKEFWTWWSMRQRCSNPKVRGYSSYGGRGIKVCEAWNESFLNFYNDMGPKPSKNHSIDRIDVNGNYEPSNCRWATKEVQFSNLRKNVFLTMDGKTKTLREWSRETGKSVGNLRYRKDIMKMSDKDILTLEPNSRVYGSSKIKGVYEHPKRIGKKWQARVSLPNKKSKSLGYYFTKEEAAEAYQNFKKQENHALQR